MVAHDLRNPLQGIANAVFYLKRKISSQPSDKERDMLKIIEDDVKYSEKIVKDLLDYSKDYRLDQRESTPRELVWSSLSLVTIPEKIELVDSTTDARSFNSCKDSINACLFYLLV
jgi:K+-sensing histidine kinase KdpD